MTKQLTILFLVPLLISCGSSKSADTVVVSAASSLTYALEALAASYTETHPGTTVNLNFGGTGSLAQQIRQGAPVDLFLAADIAQLEVLAQEGLLTHQRLRFYGQLVIWCRDDGPCPSSFADLVHGDFERIAIGHPRIAPYGTAAVAAIDAAGLSSQLTPRLIEGQTARAALRYAENGDADVALTALSLARAVGGEWIAVPDSLYPPIEQGMALVRHPTRSVAVTAAAQEFFAFVSGPVGRKILSDHGFRIDDHP